MRRIPSWLAGIAVAATAAASACTATTSANGGNGVAPGGSAPVAALPDLQLAAALQPFAACDDLLNQVKQAALDRVGPWGLPSAGSGSPPIRFEEDSGAPTHGNMPATTTNPPTTMASSSPTPDLGPAPTSLGSRDSSVDQKTLDSSESTANASAPADSTTPDHSETNVQEKGVDEPDTVKSDGKRILVVTGNRMIYVDVRASAPMSAGSIALPGNGNAQLLVSGDHVLVLSGDEGYATPQPADRRGGIAPPTPTTVLSIIDVSDPGNMKVLHTSRIDGRLVSARMVDGQARVVTSSGPAPLPFVMPSTSTAAAEQAAEDANKHIIETSKIEDWVPLVHIGDGSQPTTKPLLDCAHMSHPKTFSGFGVLAVTSVDVRANEVNPADSIGIMADGQIVYASKDNLYVATPAYVDPPRPPMLTPGTGPTTTMPAAIPLRNATSIHKFSITAPGPAIYRASGDVEGSLLSQFSMSEDAGSLRVATTTSPINCGRCASTETFVRVLQEADGALKQVGQVGNMGRGEQIKSVRFVGTRGYVVTFRQTDPLFTLDLSNPTDPKVVGELKLLGFSAYLHPAGDNMVIGIGQDATAQGRTTGTKVALFDMADLANPRELQSYTLWNSTNEVEQDFHAFLWWDPTSLAVVPVSRAYVGYIHNGPCRANGVCPQSYVPPFTGAVGLRIKPDGISEVGRIVNPSGYVPMPCDDNPASGVCAPPCPPDARCTSNGTTRGPIDCSQGSCGGQGAPPSCPAESPELCAPTPTMPTTVPSRPFCDPAACEPAPPTTVPPDRYCVYHGPCPPYVQEGARIERSMVVGDTVYTFSANGLKSSDLNDLHEKYWLPFA